MRCSSCSIAAVVKVFACCFRSAAKMPRYAFLSISSFISTPYNLASLAEPYIKPNEKSTLSERHQQRGRPPSPSGKASIYHTTSLRSQKYNSSARHQNLRSRTFSARARSSSKPHNLASLAEPFIKPNE